MDYAKQFESPRKGEQGHGKAPADPPAATAAPPPPPWESISAAAREPVCAPQCDATPVPRAAPHAHKPARKAPCLYPPPVQRSRCRTAVVTVFRVVVAVLALAMLALTIAGQILPFCKMSDPREEEKYSVWQISVTTIRKAETEREAREDNAAEKALAVVSAGLSLLACILCFVSVGLWATYERERRREAEAYRRAQRHADELRRQGQQLDTISPAQQHHNNNHTNISGGGHQARRTHHAELSPQDSSKGNSPTAYPRAFGTKEELYERERQRRRVDNDVGIAAFTFLLLAAAACLVTVALMASFYHEEVADEVGEKKGEAAGFMAGFILFIIALAIGVVAFIVMALPCATGVYLCCAPHVSTPKTPASSSSPTNSEDGEAARYAAAAAPTTRPAATRPGNNTTNNTTPANHHNADSAARNASAPPPPSATQVHRNGQQTAGARYQDTQVHNSSPPPAAAREAPQPYVPTMVGTYPDALPGPASMEHVTMHHVPQNGETHGVWGGGEAASGQPIGDARRASHEANGGYASGGFYTSSP